MEAGIPMVTLKLSKDVSKLDSALISLVLAASTSCSASATSSGLARSMDRASR